MTPFFHDDHLTVYQGDCREVMAAMEPESVHCVITSPPYWGLRDYGIGDKGIGLEATPEAFVANMVDVFREVRRVLRKDGTLWLNLGDSYSQGGYAGDDSPTNARRIAEGSGMDGNFRFSSRTQERQGGKKLQRKASDIGLKPKDLVGIPWRVAFALQADGWYLRSDIIWAKPNPMPESVTDRPTKAHEYLFLLTKSARYYFDADAVREPHDEPWRGAGNADQIGKSSENDRKSFGIGGSTRVRSGTLNGADGPGTQRVYNPAGRNLRSVWTIATAPYPGAHFATFPPKLVEPCVKAGTSERGVCGECGAPWVRESDVEYEHLATRRSTAKRLNTNGAMGVRPTTGFTANKIVTTTGWSPSCAHDAEPVPGVVLDPFAGSGTTGMVAQALGRRAVLIDLNGEYLVQAMARNAQTPLGLVG